MIDERFIQHRYKSTSHAAVAGGLMSGGLFLYFYYARHELRWDLGAVLLVMALIKIGAMLYYHAKD